MFNESSYNSFPDSSCIRVLKTGPIGSLESPSLLFCGYANNKQRMKVTHTNTTTFLKQKKERES